MKSQCLELDLCSGDARAWDDFQTRTIGGTILHRAASLLAVAEASRCRVRSIVLTHDGDWVGTTPIFESRRGPVYLYVSPPDRVGIPYLGPTLSSLTGAQISRQEDRWTALIEATPGVRPPRKHPYYIRLMIGPTLQDVRWFVWKGFHVVPKYVYMLNLARPEEAILNSFNKETRRLVRKAEGQLTFREGGINEANAILHELSMRYEEQGRSFNVAPSFVRRLFSDLPAGSIRSFVVERDGTVVTGLIVLVEEDNVRAWLGGYRPRSQEPGATEYLYLRIALWACEEGKTQLDIGGANTPRIVRFKAKFNLTLRTYYSAERGSPFVIPALRARARIEGKIARADLED